MVEDESSAEAQPGGRQEADEAAELVPDEVAEAEAEVTEAEEEESEEAVPDAVQDTAEKAMQVASGVEDESLAVEAGGSVETGKWRMNSPPPAVAAQRGMPALAPRLCRRGQGKPTAGRTAAERWSGRDKWAKIDAGSHPHPLPPPTHPRTHTHTRTHNRRSRRPNGAHGRPANTQASSTHAAHGGRCRTALSPKPVGLGPRPTDRGSAPERARGGCTTKRAVGTGLRAN